MQPDDNTQAFPTNDDPVPPAPDDDPDEPVQPLPQDGSPPFSPPTDVPSDGVTPDHPVADTNIQPEEVYEEGHGGATEASDPLKDRPVP